MISSPAKRTKKSATMGVVRQYKSILIAVVLTAMITSQLTMNTVLITCDKAVGEKENAAFDAPKSIHRLEPPSSPSNRTSKPTTASAVTVKNEPTNENANANANADPSSSTTTTAKMKEDRIPDDPYTFETIPSRTWKVFEHRFPCYPPAPADKIMSTNPCHEGILFQRPEKVGSTTMTNVVMRLAFNRGATVSGYSDRDKLSKENRTKLHREWKVPARCQHRSMHGSSVSLDYPNRDREKSFLFSLLRDPIERIRSMFFHFGVSVHQVEPIDKNFAEFAIRPRRANSYLQDLTHDPAVPERLISDFKEHLSHRKSARGSKHIKPHNDTGGDDGDPAPLNHTKIVADILDRFDFIAVTERLDESLVALKLLLNLTVEEILYAKVSRSAGSYSNGRGDRPCVYIVPSFLTRRMREFFYGPGRNDAWLAHSSGDALLHRAANRSLDRTIDEVFGRDRFGRELGEFRNAAAYANAVCHSEPGLILGLCDDGGNFVRKDPRRNTTCYIWSEGCDHKCLNERVPNPIPREVLDGTRTFSGGDGDR